MKRKPKTSATALSTFEERKEQIMQRAARLVADLEAYDREISGYPGGHGNWGHAGTLSNILGSLAECEEMLASARANTRAGATKGAW